MASDIMSPTPAPCRETHALWRFHHTLGFGLRKLKSRIGHADNAVITLALSMAGEIMDAIAQRSAILKEERPPHAKWPHWRSRRARMAAETGMTDSALVGSKPLQATIASRRMLRVHVSDESTTVPADDVFSNHGD